MAAALSPPSSVPRVEADHSVHCSQWPVPTLPHIAAANPGKVTGEWSSEPGWAAPTQGDNNWTIVEKGENAVYLNFKNLLGTQHEKKVFPIWTIPTDN